MALYILGSCYSIVSPSVATRVLCFGTSNGCSSETEKPVGTTALLEKALEKPCHVKNLSGRLAGYFDFDRWIGYPYVWHHHGREPQHSLELELVPSEARTNDHRVLTHCCLCYVVVLAHKPTRQ